MQTTGGAEEAGEEQRRAADRAHDERLEQAAFRVPRDDAEREEDGEDDAEEERREHREPEQEGAGEGARVDVDVRRRLDRREAREDVVGGEPEEDEERRGQQHDDREHLPPHRLAEAVAHDRQRRRSRDLVPHGLEIRVLERRREDPDAVDLPARRDRFGNEPRRILPGGSLDRPCPLVGLELDPARPRELGGRPGGDDLARAEDRDAVADELDLGEQVRVEQDGRRRGRAAPRAGRGRSGGRRGRAPRSARREASTRG